MTVPVLLPIIAKAFFLHSDITDSPKEEINVHFLFIKYSDMERAEKVQIFSRLAYSLAVMAIRIVYSTVLMLYGALVCIMMISRIKN